MPVSVLGSLNDGIMVFGQNFDGVTVFEAPSNPLLLFLCYVMPNYFVAHHDFSTKRAEYQKNPRPALESHFRERVV